MNFGPSNHFFEDSRVRRDSNSQNGRPLGECVGSFLRTLLHSQECECDSQVALLVCTFLYPCLGYKRRVKVMITKVFSRINLRSKYYQI
jgi:hypothetical protein